MCLHHTEFKCITPINGQKIIQTLILTLIHVVNMTSKDFKCSQLTSKDLNRSQNSPEVKAVKSQNKSKGGANVEINDEYLDEILQNHNSYLELAMQIISNDKTGRIDTIQDLKEFNSQPFSTEAKKVNNSLARCLLLRKLLN